MPEPIVYRKRPVEVTGLLFTGTNHDELESFVGWDIWEEGDGHARVWNTSQGAWNDVNAGDTILRGLVGECYPCSADALAATYDTAAGHASNGDRAAELDHMAAKIDRGPTFALPPSVLSALVRERAAELRAEAGPAPEREPR